MRPTERLTYFDTINLFPFACFLVPFFIRRSRTKAEGVDCGIVLPRDACRLTSRKALHKLRIQVFL